LSEIGPIFRSHPEFPGWNPAIRKALSGLPRPPPRLSVPLGQWIEIGATRQAGNEVLDAILESGSGTKTSLLSMSLMVETF